MSRTTGILAVIFCSLLLAVLSGPMASAQQPPNDSCAGALPITGEVNEFFLTFGATTDSSLFDAGVCGFDRIFNDVWYCYTATATGTCVVSTCQNAFFDTRIAVFNGCSCPADPSNVVSCNDNCPADTVNGTSTATFDATAGSQYLICIGSASPAQFGEGGFTVSCATPCDPLPDAEFFAAQLPDGPGVPPFTVAFNASPSTGTNLDPYTWDFGDGSLPGDGMNPTHTYDSAGDYMVQLTVFDSCGNQDSQLVGVAVCDPLDVDFSWQPNPFPPQTIDFLPDTTGTGPFSYDWDFGDGNGSNVDQAQHTYFNPGFYTVVLTMTDACGVEKEREHEIEVIDCLTLVPNFTESATSGPPGLTVNFTDTTSGTGPFLYLWNFGDGTVSDVANPSHTFNFVGTYTVVLTVTDVCLNVEPAEVEIIITDDPCEAPTAIFSWNETLPLMVAFNDASTGTLPFTSYTWSFGDGGVSNVANPSHLYAAAGNYGVSLTVTSDCGQSIEEDVVEVTGAPSADEEFVRGDTNGDGVINISDAVRLLTYLFPGPFGSGPLPCLETGDLNDDGVVDISDVVFLLTYLFPPLQGDSSPPPPFGSCGLDPTDDNLTCDSFDVCD